MDVVRFEEVSKAFPRRDGGRNRAAQRSAQRSARRGDRAFDVGLAEVSFALGPGEAVGVLGRPGAGRSTLARLITGVYRPDTGRVLVRGRASGLVGAGVGFARSSTVRANIVRSGVLLGGSRRTLRRQAPEIAAFAGLEDLLDTRLRDLGSNRVRLLAHAVALHVETPVFVADEQLAIGSDRVREDTFARLEGMRDAGRTLVLVTNTAKDLQRLCTRGMVLEHGALVFDGAVQGAIRQYRRRGRGTGGESS
jgi:ABC-2 type transport system ATP-binding protein